MGQVEIKKIIIPYTMAERTVRVYLPDSYNQNEEQRYPVLYMHDGQNLFCDESAYGATSWGVIEEAEKAVKENKAREFIVVGLDNEGERRFEDYSPWKNTAGGDFLPVGTHGGDGELYADFFVKELLPFINAAYRTLPGAENTALAGSSMGGLITAYMIAKYPQFFSGAGIFSMASWFAEQEFLEFVKQSDSKPETKFFIQVGTMETVAPQIEEMPQIFIDATLKYCRVLLEKGVLIQDINLNIGAGDVHSERSWRNYMQSFFAFVFPVQGNEIA